VDRGGGTQDTAEAVRARREAVVLGVDGISDFNALHSGKHDNEVRNDILRLRHLG
jgi:hypothetical protein